MKGYLGQISEADRFLQWDDVLAVIAMVSRDASRAADFDLMECRYFRTFSA